MNITMESYSQSCWLTVIWKIMVKYPKYGVVRIFNFKYYEFAYLVVDYHE